MLAGILLAACIVPERWHVTAIIASRSAGTIAQRLKHESFNTVAKSIPPRGTEVGFKDLGWIFRAELDALNHVAAASLPAHRTVVVDAGFARQFFHLEGVRAPMSCERAIARYPTDQLALLARAAWEWQAGQRRAAVADYSTVVRLNPESFTARYGRAYAYYSAGDYKAALDDAQAAVSARGSSGDAHTLVGIIEEARGDDDLATADLGYGIAQYRGYLMDDSEGRHALGVAYENLGYFAAAVDEFDAVLKKHPSRTSVYMPRGFAWFSRGDLAKARDDFTAASHAAPRLVTPYLGLAMLSFSNGDAAAALGHAQAALRADPHDAYAALWVLVASRALHRTAQLAHPEAFANSADWPAAATRVFLDRAPVESLEAAAASPDAFTARVRLCEARFYGAAYMLAAGDGAHAFPLLRLAVGECPYREYERATADQMLRTVK